MWFTPLGIRCIHLSWSRLVLFICPRKHPSNSDSCNKSWGWTECSIFTTPSTAVPLYCSVILGLCTAGWHDISHVCLCPLKHGWTLCTTTQQTILLQTVHVNLHNFTPLTWWEFMAGSLQFGAFGHQMGDQWVIDQFTYPALIYTYKCSLVHWTDVLSNGNPSVSRGSKL